jgi:hypothetical protein
MLTFKANNNGTSYYRQAFLRKIVWILVRICTTMENNPWFNASGVSGIAFTQDALMGCLNAYPAFAPGWQSWHRSVLNLRSLEI